MKEIFSSADFWKFAIPLSGAVVAWFVNEWRKRAWEQYQRKEESYRQLVHCLKGFYIGASDSKRLREEFLDQLNQCWLYCPDEVILNGYSFLNTVDDQQQHTNESKQKAMGDFVASIRRDLLSRKLVKTTTLTGDDFRHLTANN